MSSLYKVKKLEQEYRSPRFNHELVSWNDYIDEPKEDGYRGLHLIFKYKSKNAFDFNNLLIELQLRTKYQHAWATAVETMDIYLGQALKLGKGDPKWKKFFKTTSMAFSILEGAPPVPGYLRYSSRKIFQEVRRMDDELNVLDKLNGFSIATNMILDEPGVGVYNLITLNIDERSVRILTFPKSKLDEANRELTELEREYSDDKSVDSVLVSAGPLRDLKKSYPNYFLDTHDFIRKVKKIIALSKTSERNIIETSPRRKAYKKSDARDEVKNLLFGRDIPQGDGLNSIRKVVQVINEGKKSIGDIHKATGYNPRHIQYKISSAVILGFIDEIDKFTITSKGIFWLQKSIDDIEEIRFLKKCIEDTRFYKLIGHDLFSSKRPTKEVIAKRIMDFANLSETTAYRRAGTLITWANKIAQVGLPL